MYYFKGHGLHYSLYTSTQLHHHETRINNCINRVFVMTVFVMVRCVQVCLCLSVVFATPLSPWQLPKHLVWEIVSQRLPARRDTQPHFNAHCTIASISMEIFFFPQFSCHYNSITSMASFPGLWCRGVPCHPCWGDLCSGSSANWYFSEEQRVLLTCPSWQNMWESSLPFCVLQVKVQRQLHEYRFGSSAFYWSQD